MYSTICPISFKFCKFVLQGVVICKIVYFYGMDVSSFDGKTSIDTTEEGMNI